MTSKRGNRPRRGAVREDLAVVALSRDELAVLERVSHYYERSMGLMRFVVQIASNRETKTKFAFIQDESRWLERFVASTLGQMETEQVGSLDVSFTPRALVAFWGRLLSSTNTPRSRRKLRGKELAAREALGNKLAAAVLDVARADRGLAAEQIGTRRVREVRWMHAYLAEHGVDLSAPKNL